MIKSFKHPFNECEIWNDGPELEDFMGREGAPAIARKHLCSGGGKTGTSTQNQSSNTSGNPQAIADANTVWNQAFAASQAPFQQYGGQFVSPINQQQTTGISGINQAAGMYAPYGQQATQTLAPYYGQATQSLGQGLSAGQGLTGAGVGLTAANANLNPNTVASFESPYIQNVVQATENQQNQQNAQQQSQLSGSAIQSGAFGGDRSGVAAANLAYQQNLANQPVIAGLENTGYQQALTAAQTQQQTGLQAGAQLGVLGNQLYSQGLGGSQQYASLGSGLSSAYSNLGTTAQTNALNAAQAQVGAGTLQQQTAQAQDTAQYNQFLQQQAYPFQTSQFLSNILSGTAPVYGSTTNSTGTATTPMSFFQRGGRIHKEGGGGLSGDADTQVALAGDRWTDPSSGETYESRGPWGAGPNHGEYRDYMNTPEASQEYTRYKGMNEEDRAKFAPRYLKMPHPDPARSTKDPSRYPYLEMWRRLDPGFVSSARGGRVERAGGGGLSSANDNSVIAQILATQAGMYPGSNTLYGGNVSGGPYGLALSQHGNMQLPQSHLQPMQISKPENGARAAMQDLNGATQFGENLGKLYTAGKGAVVGKPQTTGPNGAIIPATGGLGGYGGQWGANAPASSPTAQGGASNVVYLNPAGVPVSSGSGLSSAAPAVDPADYTETYRRGGRVGLAYGGIPYADQINDPIVPADIADPMQANATQEANLTRPSSQGMGSGQLSSGLGAGLKGVGSLMSGFADIAPFLGLQKGGRVHKDTGGGLSDTPDAPPAADNTFDKMLVAESGNKHVDDKGNVIVSPKGAVGVAQVMPSTGPSAAKLAGLDWDAGRLQSDPDYNKKLGKAYYEEQKRQFNDPVVAAAAYNAGPEAVRGALARAQKEGGSYLDYLPKETQSYVAKVGGGNAAAPNSAGLSAVTPQGSPGSNVAAGPQSWWDKESGGLSGTERAVITALSGLGGMASSPSRFFGGALLSGLGAGANTYAGLAQKGQSLDIAQQQANTAQTGKAVEVAKFWQGRFEPRLDPKTGATVYFDKMSGQTVTPQQYQQIMGGVSSMLPGSNGQILKPGVYTPSPISGGTAAPPAGGARPNAAPANALGPIAKPPAALPDGTPIVDQPSTGAPAPAQPTAPAAIPSVERETDPNYLFGEANRLNELAQQADAIGQKDQAGGFRSQAEQMTKRATEAAAVSEKAKMLPEAQGTALKATYATNRKTMDDAAAEAKLGIQTKAQAQAMMDLYFDPKTGKPNVSGGPAGAHLATVGAMLKQAGFSDDLVKQWTGTNPNDAQALEKLRTSLGAEAARQDIGGPVRQQEFQRFLATTPSIELLPGAFKRIVEGIIMPKSEAQIGAYKSIADLDPAKDNIQKKHLEYLESHPFYKPEPAQTPAVGGPSAIPPANERTVGKSYTNSNGVSAIWTGSGWQKVQ